MSRFIFALALISLFAATALAVAKPHAVTFGKWTTVKWLIGPEEDQPIDLKVRPLLVDGHIKEYTLDTPHDITERLFVVRRAFRVNDSLPDEKSPQHWRWERGGWLLVDRISTHISQINLPEFDSYSSVASWYRDYVAYCGVSDDGSKLYQIVTQLGRRKPVLRKVVASALSLEMPDSACSTPNWQRQPARVSFSLGGDDKSTYEVRGHAVNLIRDDDGDELGSD
jgi:hypothetical protein